MLVILSGNAGASGPDRPLPARWQGYAIDPGGMAPTLSEGKWGKVRPIDFVGVLALGALWGASFIFMRVAAPEFNPLPVADLRVIIGGLLLLAVALPAGLRLDVRTRWPQYLVLGTMNVAIPYALISAAATELPASFSSILIATTPVFAAIVGWLWLRDPLTGRQVIGVVLGLAGVALLVGWTPLDVTVRVVLSIAAVVAAAMCYGFCSHYSARALRFGAGMEIPIMQQLTAAVLLLPFAAVSVPDTGPSGKAILSVVALGLFTTGVAVLLFFRLIRRVGPFQTNIATYFTPAFGILWGALLLDERLSVGTFVGFGVILASALMMSGVGLARLRDRRRFTASGSRPPRRRVT